MSIDFRAQNIQTEKIIVTGDPDAPLDRTQLIIYPIQAQGTPINQGDIGDAGLAADATSTDVFMYVSGAIGGKGGSTKGITVFGGDIHVSGNFSLDGTGGGSGGGTSQQTVTQTAHGFTLTNLIPIPVYWESVANEWVVADHTPSQRVKQAFIVSITDANTFVVQLHGYHTLTPGHGLVDGDYYWGSSTPPYYTATAPATGSIAQSLWVVENNRLQLLNQASYLVTENTLTLQDVITTGTPDNDVNVPTANPIVLRDGGVAGFNTISFIKTGAGAGSQLYLSSSAATTGPVIKIDVASGSTTQDNIVEINNGTARISLASSWLELTNPDYGGFEIYQTNSTGGTDGRYIYITGGWGHELGTGGGAALYGGGGGAGGIGGIATVQGGGGGYISGSGGEAILQGGAASIGTGGIARVAGGNNDFGDYRAGNAIVEGGRNIGTPGVSSGSAGDVIIRGGYTDHLGPGGNLFLSGGYSTYSGSAGNVYLIGGTTAGGGISGKIIVESTMHFSQSIFTDINTTSSASRDLANSESGKVVFVNTSGSAVTFIASGSVLSTGWSTMLIREGGNSLFVSGTASTTLVGPAVVGGAVLVSVDYGGVSMVKRSDSIIWCAGVTS